MGAILAIFVRQPKFSRRALAQLSAAAVGATALLALFGAPFGILSRLKPLGATLMLTAAHLFFLSLIGFTLLVGTSEWSLLVDRPVLRFFGKISYGLYLIHWIIFASWDAITGTSWLSLSLPTGHGRLLLIRFLGAAGTATGLAYLSRRYFEEPFLRLKGDTDQANKGLYRP
jgi:peptidoglycan/LPS O-acetylase OafA/YrhL